MLSTLRKIHGVPKFGNVARNDGLVSESINVIIDPQGTRVWKKTLESFELVGMKITFLLTRTDDLLGLPDQSRDPGDRHEYQDIILKRVRAKAKIEELESKMPNLKNMLKM